MICGRRGTRIPNKNINYSCQGSEKEAIKTEGDSKETECESESVCVRSLTTLQGYKPQRVSLAVYECEREQNKNVSEWRREKGREAA